jgi:hypothetical protein
MTVESQPNRTYDAESVSSRQIPIHVEFEAQEADIQRLIQLGAERVSFGRDWIVLRDPIPPAERAVMGPPRTGCASMARRSLSRTRGS